MTLPHCLAAPIARATGSALSAVLLLTSGCAVTGGNYEERLRAALPAPRSAEIIDHARHRGGVTCGRYTALGASGMTFVSHDFIVAPARVFTRPRPVETAVLCSDDPAAALRRELGIGPGADGDWRRLRRVHDDMLAIADAVGHYFDTQATQPRALALLVEDGYLPAAQLRDPWGGSYAYEKRLGGRVKTRPGLSCLGADGAVGGGGPEDADIHLRDLPLLAHVLRLQGR